MRVSAWEEGAIQRAADLIRGGGLVAFPTETVYGLGADACNPQAVARIFEAKRRPRFDPLIVHLQEAQAASQFGVISPEAEALGRAFWPGPLTLVVPKKPVIPPIVTAGLETVALRVPAHPVALALLRAAARPVAAPSANPFGYVSPTTADHVLEHLDGEADLVLDGGPCPVGIESTILALDGPRPRLLRAGGTALEELERIAGPVERADAARENPEAPGQLERHYSTRTPLSIVEPAKLGAIRIASGEKIGLLSLEPNRQAARFSAVQVLSPSGDMREAAASLFAALRRLDSAGLDRIIALPVPEQGVGMAIMDRLRRCAAR